MNVLGVTRVSLQVAPNTTIKLTKNEVTVITYDTKYVSGDAQKVVTTINENKSVSKGDTGGGGTTSNFNYKEGNRIIISPNIGMIESKEAVRHSFLSDKQFFIYENSRDNWGLVRNIHREYGMDEQNIVINTTPDQITSLTEDLYEELRRIPIFIDEAHAYTENANYRTVMGEFMELVYNEWEVPFILSTATPFYKNLDIPNDIDIKYYHIKKEVPRIKKLALSYQSTAINQFVYEQYEQNNPVVVFTNDAKLHKSFADLRVKCLVGDTLEKKLAPIVTDRLVHPREIDFSELDVLTVSSSYFAGFDIKEDVSVLIVSNPDNDAYKINVNNIVQAYGRCRNKVIDALCVVKNIDNTDAPKINEVDIDIKYREYLEKVEQVPKAIKSANTTKETPIVKGRHGIYPNRLELLSEVVETVDNYQLYNKDVFKTTLKNYGFTISDYVSEKQRYSHSLGSTFRKRITNLIDGRDTGQLGNDFTTIKYNIKNRENGTFTPSLALEYVTAYIISYSGAKAPNSKLRNNKKVSASKFYESFRSFLLANMNTDVLYDMPSQKEITSCKTNYYDPEIEFLLDKIDDVVHNWLMLYQIYLINQNRFISKIERNLTITQLFSDKTIYNKFYNDKSNRNKNVHNAVVKALKAKEIELNEYELGRLKKRMKSNFKILDGGSSIDYMSSIKHLKSLMIEAIIFCISKGISCKRVTRGHREYNPLTALHRELRSVLPIKYVEVDLSSANCQIIDAMLNTNYADKVYTKLMAYYKISRGEAKVLFNATLNNHRLSIKKATEIYRNAGYSNSKATELANITANTKRGAFFKVMTEYEARLISLYQSILDSKTFRFHDALVFPESYILDNNITLPTSIVVNVSNTDIQVVQQNRDIQFHIGYYNDIDLEYNGKVTDESHKTSNSIKTTPKRNYMKRASFYFSDCRCP